MIQSLQNNMRASKTVRWIVLLCLAIPMFGSYFFDDMFSMVSQIFKNPELLELNWDSEDYGFYGGAYSSLCVFGGLIICGMLLDKWGVRFTGTLFVSLMVSGSMIVAYALSPAFSGSIVANFVGDRLGFAKPSLATAYAGCALFGLGSEIAGVAVTKSIAKWFKGREMALAMGLQLALARLGTAIALLLAPMVIAAKQNTYLPLAESNNMSEIGLFLMIIGFITWFVFISFDKKADKQNAAALNNENEDEKFKFSDIGKILTNKHFILISLLCVFFYCCVNSFKRFAAAILEPRFGEVAISLFGVEFKTSSIMMILLPVFTIVFTPLFGSALDNKGKATKWLMVGSVVVLCAHLIIAFAPRIQIFGFVGLSLLGIGYSLVPAAMWPSVTKIIPENKLGTAYSLIFWIQNIGLMLVPVVIGKIFMLADSLSAVIYAELVFIVLACIAIVISLVLKKSSQNHPELKLDEPNKIEN
ncbi:MAG: MFS transporter [Prevotellaceae bacterium]|jgi:MFS family permease|nr:MFS transporter [Prevotellaceae bacterium]